MEIRALRASDDRSRFSSGDADLDRFFRAFAGQNQFDKYIGTTYVAVEGGSIVGFVTVAGASLGLDKLPPKARKGLPKYDPPILRLARLGVEAAQVGKGVGELLVRHVLILAIQQAVQVGCVGVLVDAKPGRESYYARFGFEPCPADSGESPQRPAPSPMFLTTAAIKSAIDARKT